MPEAQLADSGSGLAPVTDGWFAVNVRDAEWWISERRGAACNFESEERRPPLEFAQLGINVTVLEPGTAERPLPLRGGPGGVPRLVRSVQAAGRGRGATPPAVGLLPLSPWTEHILVGEGDGPCVILMAGTRSSTQVRYPVSELAARNGASVDEEISDWRQAYATFERSRRERPSYWDRLPWA